MNSVTKKKRESELDAMRGIAAFLVVLFHYSGLTGFNLPFLKYGVTGVDLFFLISGYVIFLTLEKTATIRDFIVSRISRIYPSYLVMIPITVITMHLLSKAPLPSFKVILGNICMMQPVFLVTYIDDVYWTLTVEIQFYIFMLLIYRFNKLDKIEWIGLFVLIIIQMFYFFAGWTKEKLW